MIINFFFLIIYFYKYSLVQSHSLPIKQKSLNHYLEIGYMDNLKNSNNQRNSLIEEKGKDKQVLVEFHPISTCIFLRINQITWNRSHAPCLRSV